MTAQGGGLAPRPKVTAAAAAGAAALIIVFALGRLGLDVPADLATAITTLLAAGAGYLWPDRSQES
jgi:hypothetical protein